jgi:hypothetical protein
LATKVPPALETVDAAPDEEAPLAYRTMYVELVPVVAATTCGACAMTTAAVVRSRPLVAARALRRGD